MSPAQPNASGRQRDLELLATGHDTGWWDVHGRPAPWPDDFWLPDGTINPDWRPSGHTPEEETDPSIPSENNNF